MYRKKCIFQYKKCNQKVENYVSEKKIHINLGFMGCTHYCLTLKNNYRARLKQNTEWIHLSNHNGNLITGHR